jgi:hypothetical protein
MRSEYRKRVLSSKKVNLKTREDATSRMIEDSGIETLA